MFNEIPNELLSFSGNRNAVLTVIIPPDKLITKVILNIETRVKQIKHSYKRNQIYKVLNLIKEKIAKENLKDFNPAGGIICAGFDIKGDSYYNIIYTRIPIDKIEYFYDYKFNTKRINYLINADIYNNIPSSEVDNIMAKLLSEDNGDIAVGEKEINLALEFKIVKELYQKEEVTSERINLIRQNQGKIICTSGKYPNIALLKYPFDIQSMLNVKYLKEDLSLY